MFVLVLGPYGIAFGLAASETQYIKWTGHLFALAGSTLDPDFPASLRSLVFYSFTPSHYESLESGIYTITNAKFMNIAILQDDNDDSMIVAGVEDNQSGEKVSQLFSSKGNPRNCG